MIYPRNLGGEEVQIWESVGKIIHFDILWEIFKQNEG